MLDQLFLFSEFGNRLGSRTSILGKPADHISVLHMLVSIIFHICASDEQMGV